MAQIVPTLNLNKTPALVENNSLVFAKNIRLDVDKTINRDYGISNILDKNLILSLKEQLDTTNDADKHCNDILKDYKSYTIIDVIPSDTEFYILLDLRYSSGHKNIIVKFDEHTNKLSYCNCNWNYTDGTISGLVTNNLLGETMLVIAECSETQKVPLKCINLSKSNYDDDETIYTQTPNIPFINLLYFKDYKFSIPNGVYQFFIRYKIRENYYTSWFPASRELFAGNEYNTDTIYGTVKYHKDVINSNNSFVFNINTLFNEYTKNYKEYQIGFIVSNKQTTKARAWKHFSFDTKIIYFDYKSEDAEEIDVTDFTNPIFGLYNVKNVALYKNKLYISNYEEFNFNETFNVDNITINTQDNKVYSGTYNTTFTSLYYGNHVCTITDNKTITNINFYNNETIYDILCNKGLADIIYDAINTHVNNEYTIKFSKDNYNIDTNIIVNTSITNYKENKEYKMYFYSKNTVNDKEVYSNGCDITYDNILSLLSENIDESIVLYFSNYILLRTNYSIILTDAGDPDSDDACVIQLAINFDLNLIHNIINDVTCISTLLPKQKYNIYIHYVKQTGETTNGIFVKSIWIPYDNNDFNKPISLYFSNITIPNGYVCCFFSIVLVENKISTVLISKDNTVTKYDGYCIDLNCGLNSFPKEVTIITKDNNDKKGIYYDSNDTTSCRYFGAQGLIATDCYDDKALIINNYKETDYEHLNLIKATPYISKNYYSDCLNENLLGFICKIYQLHNEKTTQIYNDGSSLYSKSNKLENIDMLKLTEFNKYKEREPARNTNWLGSINLIRTNPVYIYSNFNLNYLQLSDDLKPKYTTYYDTSETDNVTIRTSYNKFLYMVESLLLSTMYKLDSTYYNYDRKYYSVYNKKDVYKFNNTIRCSIKNSDEDNLNTFKFDAIDYYNIPTDKNIITYLNTIGDIIIVHTKDTMFKFSGNNTLQSNTGDVQQIESDVFDTGVSEIFTSTYGYAGLNDKTKQITTNSAYVFYDEDCNIIYLYSGNGQLVKISDDIEKIFRYDSISDIYFANDFYNNRFFISIFFKNDKTLTLSYFLSEETKCFVSTHDFVFTKSFNTKTKCYFIENNNIYTIDKNNLGNYSKLSTTTSIYPYASNRNNKGTKFSSIIDIIENTNYENIKTLNFINWNCSTIKNEFPIYNEEELYYNALAQESETYPCDKLRIYSNDCSTDLIQCDDNSNDSKLTDVNYYKYPRYNQGYWSLNYFRNILNSNGNTTRYSGDENSLIEGKYFVARFVFNSNFKFETINFNYNEKL